MRALFCLIALGVATSASAEEARMVVPYGDLNLATPIGVAALDRRLDAAVRHVCSGGELDDLNLWTSRQQCLRTARNSANQGRLTAMATVASSTQLASAR